MLLKYKIENYFVFDMSIPELVMYKKSGIKYFTRISDVEKIPVMEETSEGLWIDTFFDDNRNLRKEVERYILQGKIICLVSPELHGRDYKKTWQYIKENHWSNFSNFLLCTDKPEEARRYFNEE